MSNISMYSSAQTSPNGKSSVWIAIVRSRVLYRVPKVFRLVPVLGFNFTLSGEEIVCYHFAGSIK